MKIDGREVREVREVLLVIVKMNEGGCGRKKGKVLKLGARERFMCDAAMSGRQVPVRIGKDRLAQHPTTFNIQHPTSKLHPLRSTLAQPHNNTNPTTGNGLTNYATSSHQHEDGTRTSREMVPGSQVTWFAKEKKG